MLCVSLWNKEKGIVQCFATDDENDIRIEQAKEKGFVLMSISLKI
jgi:hypothetical protein